MLRNRILSGSLVNHNPSRLLVSSSNYLSVGPKSCTTRFYSGATKATLSEEHAESATKIPDPLHGSYHWIYERALSVASLGLIAGAFVVPGKGFIDLALGIVIPLHSHVGFGAIITDYIPARKFPRLYPFARGVLGAATVGTLYGLYMYNTNDMGITEGVRSLWKADKAHVRED